MPESNKDEGKASCFKTAFAVVLGTSHSCWKCEIQEALDRWHRDIL